MITTNQLSRRYGRRIGIESVDLDVAEGTIFGFIGPNGSGKTTTIRILLGLLRPSGGSARVFGLDCWRDSHRIKHEVGYLPGDLRLYPWLTGGLAMRIVGLVRGRELTAAGRELADRFGLPLDVPVRAMSRGMRQKLGIILALVHDPKLLVLDEPTTALDPPMRSELAACLRDRAARGGTVFFSSHTLSEVEQLCQRVAIVREGRIVADEPLETLRNRARRSVTVCFREPEAATRTLPPDFLRVRERQTAVWRCELQGATPPLIQWAAGQLLADLTIGPPDLETLFLEFYRTEDGRPS